MKRTAAYLLVVLLISIVPVGAEAEFCVYLDAKGVLRQARSRDEVPAESRAAAKCFEDRVVPGKTPAPPPPALAAPQDINLKGNIRVEHMSSNVGRVQLRWPRKVEVLFGRTPQRAVSDAARTVGRALKTPGFAQHVQNLALEWKIVFMDEELPETQIPQYLVSNCHPAWMTPPANLYIVAQRVVAGCGGGRAPGTSVADSELGHVLLHEMGHAVEYQLLQGKGARDRMRAEGFASWFEQYASGFSSVVMRGSVERFYRDHAVRSFKERGAFFNFRGTVEDYAHASMYFNAIVDRRGLSALMQVYDSIAEEGLDFSGAIRRKLGWDERRVQQELARLLE